MSFTLDRAALTEFARVHQRSILLVMRGASDYVGARCCLLNGVLSGLELGAQAVEKHLKAMLLFAVPETNVRAFNHKLPSLGKAVQEKGIANIMHCLPTIEKLQAHYQARYPDNPGQTLSASTGELEELDAVMNHFLDVMPIPKEVSLRSGVYALVTASSFRNMITPDEQWLLECNPMLQARVPALVEQTRQWLQYAYPPAT